MQAEPQTPIGRGKCALRCPSLSLTLIHATLLNYTAISRVSTCLFNFIRLYLIQLLFPLKSSRHSELSASGQLLKLTLNQFNSNSQISNIFYTSVLNVYLLASLAISVFTLDEFVNPRTLAVLYRAVKRRSGLDGSVRKEKEDRVVFVVSEATTEGMPIVAHMNWRA
uniref:Transmembrane protein n=1 Tax=Heterorhabditis bacteriophora TaxID=37862 RepID=A0A1I7WHB3_HETBA